MKSAFLLLFAALQTGFLSAQFDENYLGEYKTDDGISVFHIMENGTLYSDLLTAEQRQYAAFVFIYDVNTVGDKFGAAMKKGGNYVSCVTESLPQLTFVFRTESGKQMLDVTEKSGKKMTLSKMVDPYYYDEETPDSDSTNQDDPTLNPGMDVRMNSRLGSYQKYYECGNASMYVTFKGGIPLSLSMIFPSPEPEDYGMIVLEGVLETTEEQHHYVFNDDLSGNSWKVYEKRTDFFFECTEGDCFDKNEKFGLWKEPFHFVSEE